MFTKIVGKRGFILLGLLVLASWSISPNIASAAISTLTASQTVSNVILGTDNQTAATSSTVANVAEVKASTTLAIASLPASGATITVGACVITVATADSLNCNGGTATVATTTTQDGVIANARTATQFATAMQGLTYVKNPVASSSTNIIVSASSTSATSVGFSTAASSTETGGQILFTTTSGAVTQSNIVLGVAPVAQQDTITIAGTIDAGDVYTLTRNSFAPSYTVLSTDTSTTNIATGLNAAIQAYSGYASQPFTSAASTNTVVLTASSAGTGFSASTTATNRANVAQTVVFTPSNVTAGENFKIIINGRGYDYEASASEASNVVTGLVSILTNDVDVTCSAVSSTISCVAKTAGTSFTYSSGVNSIVNIGSSGRRIQSLLQPANQVSPVAINNPIVSGLRYGQENEAVKNLQLKLQQLGFLSASLKTTNYFGPLTRTALIKFQKANGLRMVGFIDDQTLALINNQSTSTNQVSPVAINNPIVSGLRYGQENEAVKNLQLKLQQLGFLSASLKTTNYFGPLTRTALIKFQKANGLRMVGFIDDQTLALINK